MKALTLTQPWATLVAIGAKRIETRSWPTNYRGPLAIHAAKGFPKWAKEFTTEPECYEAVRYHGARHAGYPLGVVLATCRLVDCVMMGNLDLMPDLLRHAERERAFGDYSPGRFAWFFEDVKELPEPIAAKGALGLWEWNVSETQAANWESPRPQAAQGGAV